VSVSPNGNAEGGKPSSKKLRQKKKITEGWGNFGRENVKPLEHWRRGPGNAKKLGRDQNWGNGEEQSINAEGKMQVKRKLGSKKSKRKVKKEVKDQAQEKRKPPRTKTPNGIWLKKKK